MLAWSASGHFRPLTLRRRKLQFWLTLHIYLQGLPSDHSFKRNENVLPFSQNLASLKVFHLIAHVTGAAGQTDFGIQRFSRFYRSSMREMLCDAEP